MKRISGTGGDTVTLPTLPAGTYQVWSEAYALVHTGVGTATLTGTGASWSPSTSNAGTGSSQGASVFVELIGTAVGGQAPSVTVSWPGTGSIDYAGLLKVFAIRIA
jgi:hypothetical protein